MSFSPTDGLVIGEDGRPRCVWGTSTPDYVTYHDEEWARPVLSDRTLFEKLCLEGFQSGLSWLTVLRKREAFREVFGDFEPAFVAELGESDIDRLLDDARIIRHRGKIEASINNAHSVMRMHEAGESLAGLIWSFRPEIEHEPTSLAEVPSTTPESKALARELKGRGFRFVGPTTAYAAMQAMGVVNDHMVGCWVRDECQQERAAALSKVPD